MSLFSRINPWYYRYKCYKRLYLEEQKQVMLYRFKMNNLVNDIKRFVDKRDGKVKQ